MASTTTIVKVLLLVLSIIGVFGTWILVQRNGALSLLEQIASRKLLPGTNQPLQKSFTGIKAVDDQLKILVIFFWQVVDGSTPTSSLQSLHFEGQVIAGWVLCMLEGLRDGNRWRIISFVAIWGMIMQNIAFAVIMPIYMAIHLSTSPTAARSRGRSPKSSIDFRVHPCDSEAVPYSILLGFVLPTVLMCLRVPTVLTYSQKQNLIAFWQAFPLWISLSHLLLSTLLKNISSISGSASRNPTDRRIVLQALRRVYMFGFASSAVIHVATVSVSLASVLTPGIFATGYRSLFRPFQVFVPISLSSAVQVSSMGEGSMYFLQWDEVVGSTALLVWAATLYRNAHGTQFDWQRWARLVAKVAGLSVIAGPCSAALALVWDRDELIWAQEDAGDKKVR